MGCLSNMSRLPEDCVSRIISLTSPKDSCKILAVSKGFRSPAESNLVWNRFLPADCDQICSPLNCSSKKELFLALCDYVLVDGGKKAFGLEKSSGKKCWIISARELSIPNGETDTNWSWKSIPESRFCEAAELVTASLLRIQGRIRTQALSLNTRYGAYLVIKISGRAYGLDSIPSEISITAGDREIASSTAYLRDPDSKKTQLEGLFYANRIEKLKERVDRVDERLPRKREDGWMEIEMGEFVIGERGGEEMVMSLMEVKGLQFKSGFIVQGIEVRPKV